jgi:nucleoside-diphosphate-sugar epimerase
MNILVIGGTRFVGYQLAWRLLAAGHRVTLLNRGTRPDPFGDRVERLVADRSTPKLSGTLAGRLFDAAVDFAAYTGDDARGAIGALGRDRVGHYILISTGQVYLVRDHCPRPAREVDYDGPVMARPADPADLDDWTYGVEKRRAEEALVEAWNESGFPSTRLRIPMVNGERDHHRRVESYLWRILDGGPVILPDGGTHATRHVYGGSVARAIVAMLGDRSTFGQAYNLAQEETPALIDLVNLLAVLVGAPARIAAVPSSEIRAVGLEPLRISPFSGRWMSFLDPTKARRELGFCHEPLRSYLGKVVAVFLNAPPPSPPETYARRADELRLAAGL